nr:hypothetical protein [Escherichia coli]
MPFLFFKARANRANPNAHVGIIRSSNLCTEIFQNTEPHYYQIKVVFENGDELHFDEEQKVAIDGGYEKPAKKISTLDSIDGNKVYISLLHTYDSRYDEGSRVNLGGRSINKKKTNTKRKRPIS